MRHNHHNDNLSPILRLVGNIKDDKKDRKLSINIDGDDLIFPLIHLEHRFDIHQYDFKKKIIR
jgi:hypothetical protein